MVPLSFSSSLAPGCRSPPVRWTADGGRRTRGGGSPSKTQLTLTMNFDGVTEEAIGSQRRRRRGVGDDGCAPGCSEKEFFREGDGVAHGYV